MCGACRWLIPAVARPSRQAEHQVCAAGGSEHGRPFQDPEGAKRDGAAVQGKPLDPRALGAGRALVGGALVRALTWS